MPSDPRAVAEYRVPAADLRPGDLVNTNPGDQDWQEVIGVYTADTAAAEDEELGALVADLDGRYVVVQLTDIAPVDSGVFFQDGEALIYGIDDGPDQAVKEIVSSEDGARTYLYTKYELVTIRSAG